MATISAFPTSGWRGTCVSQEALTERGRGQLVRSLSKRRQARFITEAGCDTAAWIGGLFAAARVTGDPAAGQIGMISLWYAAAAICAIVAGCGLAAGLYRGRYLRGSRDEVVAVALASSLITGCLTVTDLTLVTRQAALPETVLGAAVFAVVAMLGARY